jgi:hypothetical protein
VNTEHETFDAQGFEHLRNQSAMVTVGSHFGSRTSMDRNRHGIHATQVAMVLPPKQAAPASRTLA